MPFENFDEVIEKPSLEIPKEAVKLPTMPEDISLDTVYVVDGVHFTDKTEAERYQKRRQDEVARTLVKQLHSRGAKKAPDFNRGMNSRKPRP